MSRELLPYFQIRKKWDNHEYVVPVTTDLEFLKEVRQPFHGERFETLYRAVFFDTHLVHRHGFPLAVASGQGERCMKNRAHYPVHGSVHRSGERNLRKTRRLRVARRLILDTGKTPGWAGATPFWPPSAGQHFVGSLQPAPSNSGPCFARVQGSVMQFVMQPVMHHR